MYEGGVNFVHSELQEEEGGVQLVQSQWKLRFSRTTLFGTSGGRCAGRQMCTIDLLHVGMCQFNTHLI
jgi:hypothetical protein